MLPKFNNKQTNKRIKKKKPLHPLSSYSFSKPCPRNTLFHYLTIIPIIPIRSSYRELTFRVKLLLRSHARSKVYKNIYIYIYSLTIYIHTYVYIYILCVCVFTVKSVSFIRNVTLPLSYIITRTIITCQRGIGVPGET